MFDMITIELERFNQSEAMIDHPPTLTLTMTLQSVIASCIACLLLTLPSFASAQDELGTPEQDNGFQLQVPSEPISQDPPAVTTPGTQQEDQPAIPTIVEGTADAVEAVDTDPNTADGGADMAAVADTDAANSPDAGEDSGKELTLEERRAIWLAGLKKLTFKQLVKRIRDDERRINQLYINMPMTRPDQQIRFENQIAGLQAEVVKLNELLEPAAVEAFRSEPMESQAAAAKVFEVLESKLRPRGQQAKFDPAGGLRLVNTILEIKGGHVGMDPATKPTPEDEPFMQIIYQGYLASFWLQEFKTADDFLTRLENMNIGLDPKLREDFEATLAAWETEKALRSQEASVDNLPRVKLETTDGDVVIELFENEAPNTVANFIKLTKEGYYDGLEFFHVVPGSYARSGCTANDGTTNPGYRIRNELENARRHFTGTVVMQNDGENTAGSQFIILQRPDPNLEGKVVAFGRVIEGLDLIYGLESINRIRNPGGEATVITKATVLRDRGHKYEPETIEDAASMRLREAEKKMSTSESADGSSTSGSNTQGFSTGSQGSSTTGSSVIGSPTPGSSTRSPSSSGSSNRFSP